ncbi:TPA: S8/S53 family peptidase [Bacillus anthracis]|nr:S8/S53 family peptidase [Bacillus anthracis]HDR3653413.1 S8/S53 family peptidase [Bacillus anthracis]
MVKVAVIDSGVEYEHFDIISEKISGINLINQKKELGDISDQLGHGTAICSILSNSDDITSIQV